jgi:hypothetical protein
MPSALAEQAGRNSHLTLFRNDEALAQRSMTGITKAPEAPLLSRSVAEKCHHFAMA